MTSSDAKKPEAIHLELRQRIISGELKEGDRLPKESELAQAFQCSVGTVSKAVGLLVHDGLVERRQRAGTRVIRTSLAAALPSAKLDAFAFIYPSAQHESSWRIMTGFQSAAKDLRRRVVTLDTGVDCQRQEEYISRLMEFDVCGAVILPHFLASRDYAHFCGILVNSSIPIVLVNTLLQNIACPAVFFDSFHAGYSSARCLLESGAKKIGYLCNGAPTNRSYYQGYLWALEEKGQSVKEEWVLREETMHPDYDHPLTEPTLLGAKFLKQCGDQIEAVVCAQDYLAMGVIAAAKQIGKDVPRDLKVVGIDGLHCAASGAVPVTSYHFPFEEAGKKSFDLLHAVVSGDTTCPREIRLRGEIVRKASA